MSNSTETLYLERLLRVYEEKLKKFRLSFAILLIAATAFFFLIFFPYITLIGNQEDCRINQQQCTQLEQSQLNERFSEITTSWGKIPVSTAEVVVFFPVGVVCGSIAVFSQLYELMRLRTAIAQEIAQQGSPIDVTLISPLLIDPEQNFMHQISGALMLLYPVTIVSYSMRIVLVQIEIIRNRLPYFQSVRFYYLIYFLSTLFLIFSLAKIGVPFVKKLQKRRWLNANED